MELFFPSWLNLVLLNRVGIILNFAAGFMLAPELLGVDRLRRIENYIDTHASTAKHQLDVVVTGAQRLFRLIGTQALLAGMVNTIIQFGGMYSMLSSGTISIAIVPAYFIISFYMFYLFLKEYIYPGNKIKAEKNHSLFSSSTGRFFATPSVIFSFIVLIPIICIIAILNIAVSYILRKLEGEERLRSILVWWGIIFFILGNLLQFIATF